MGKISPPSIKYVIRAKFYAEGPVEKPDVIGAIFGQTEGLLGEDLELRDLQKKGKIGRIDVELKVEDSKTTGNIEIPTSIDKTETTIIAAAVETLDRVGPCDAKVEIESIDDVRSSKREYILERAKKLMEKLSNNGMEMREMGRDIASHARKAKVISYGNELLASGPDIDKNKEIIVVEGRADVINLLRTGIKNAIAMNGTMIPKTIKELSKEKQITLFIDGDRGGILIAGDAIKNAQIKYIARAPDGKEVEELTEKEILSCLRNKLSVGEFNEKILKKAKTEKEQPRERKQERETRTQTKTRYQTKTRKDRYQGRGTGTRGAREFRGTREFRKQIELEPEQDISIEKAKETLLKEAYKIEGKKISLLYGNGDDLKLLQKVSTKGTSRVVNSLEKKGKRVVAIVMDGTVTSTLINSAEKVGCKIIIAKNFNAVSDKIQMISF